MFRQEGVSPKEKVSVMKKFVIAAFAIAVSTWLFAACESSTEGVGKDTNNPSSSDGTGSDGNGTDNPWTTDTTDGTGDNGTGNNGSDPVSTDEEQCAETGFNIEVNPINMLILLDRSRSMVESKVGGQTYAKVVSQAIKNVVQANDDKDLVNFGLAVFPDLACDKSAGDNPSEAVQCRASTSTVVEIGPDNFAQISSQLDTIGTCGGTPICHSLKWAKSYLTTLDDKLSKLETYILLATDGAPNCNTTGDISSCECTTDKIPPPQDICPSQILCLDDKCSYNEALSLRKQGNKMFVIGVGDEAASWDEVMNKMAEYGGTGSYYPAGDPASLAAALENITGEAISCDFDVAWDDVPKKSGDGRTVDKKCNKVRVLKIADLDNPGQTEDIPYSYDCSDPSGWRWKGLDKELDPDANDDTPLSQCSTIELCSGACESLKNGETERVTATFGCGIIPVL